MEHASVLPQSSAGNPVKTGGGCATVTGYEFPKPLAAVAAGKAGTRSNPKPGYRLGYARRGRPKGGQLLRQREGWGQTPGLFFGRSRRI